MRTCLDTNWIQVGHIDEIPRLGARVVKTDRGDIAVFRNAGDEIFALLDRCPHKGGPLSQGIVFDRRVTCPLHNWVISLESGEATGPDSGCTSQYPVRIEDNMIYLLLDNTGARPVEYKKIAEA
jgi:nitrite reductase (NADH) small subunit